MSAKLNHLIEYYEFERDNLNELIKEDLIDQDYLAVHQHSKGLYLVETKLRTLNGFNYDDYERREFLMRYLKRLLQKNVVTSEQWEVEFNNRKIGELIKELIALGDGRKTSLTEGKIVDETLLYLVHKQIMGFKFYIRKKNNLYLDFQYKSDGNIVVSYDHTVVSEYHDNYSEALIKVGFGVTDESCLALYYKVWDFDFTPLKILISRIIFDVFHLSPKENQSFIEAY